MGEHTATSRWNLSGPLSGGRTAGDAVADLLVDTLVGVSGVPSFLEDQAHEKLSALIREDVKAVVDAHAPTELGPSGSATSVLAAALADVTVRSKLTLEPGLLPGDFKGREVVERITYEVEEERYDVFPAALLGRADVTLEAEWSGDADADAKVLDAEPHGFALHFGELVRQIALHAIDAAELGDLASGVQDAIDCTSIVTLILGADSGLSFGVGDFTVEFDESELFGACGSTRGAAEERALGLFALDSGIVIGGKLSFDEAGLTSHDDFGGYVGIAPKALAPRIRASFTTTR